MQRTGKNKWTKWINALEKKVFSKNRCFSSNIEWHTIILGTLFSERHWVYTCNFSNVFYNNILRFNKVKNTIICIKTRIILIIPLLFSCQTCQIVPRIKIIEFKGIIKESNFLTWKFWILTSGMYLIAMFFYFSDLLSP